MLDYYVAARWDADRWQGEISFFSSLFLLRRNGGGEGKPRSQECVTPRYRCQDKKCHFGRNRRELENWRRDKSECCSRN